VSGSSYTLPLCVRLYDLDISGQISCSTLLRYFEETALQASSQLGFTLDWYDERGQFWVIRGLRLERNGEARYQEELEIRTWVSFMTRVRADRNYLVRRIHDGRILARATANWVYLDRKTLRPARISPDIVAMFTNSEPAALPTRVAPKPWLRAGIPIQHLAARRAMYYEADSAKHTNNSVYVDWLEEAVRDSLMAQGFALEPDREHRLWFYRHTLEYLTPARPGDELEIKTRLTGQGKSTGFWNQEVRRLPSGDIVARGDSVTVWTDVNNRPLVWPDACEPCPSTSIAKGLREDV
jgi:acyl-CoA thioester hydrolase